MIQTHPKRMHHGKFMEEASTRQRRGCFFNLHLRDMHWTLLVKREIQEQTQLHPPFLHALYGQLHSRQGGRRQRRRRQMPGLTCDHLLDPLACRPILPASLFVKWCDLLVEQKVVVGFERFYCPNQECSALIVNECGGVVVVKVEEGDGGAPIARETFVLSVRVHGFQGVGAVRGRRWERWMENCLGTLWWPRSGVDVLLVAIVLNLWWPMQVCFTLSLFGNRKHFLFLITVLKKMISNILFFKYVLIIFIFNYFLYLYNYILI